MTRLSAPRLIAATIISILIVGLFGIRVTEAEKAASRTIGIYVTPTADPPFEVIDLKSGGPAELAGMKVGDRITGADGITFERLSDFDQVSDRFRPGVAVPFEVLRKGEPRTIHLVPGVALEWWYFPLDGIVMIASLALMILVASRGKFEIRSKLLAFMFGLIALSTALPYEALGVFWLETATWSSYYLVDAVEIAVLIHLVMLIPRRPQWLEQNPWIVPVNYALFLGIGIAAAGTYVADVVWDVRGLPWPLSHAQEIQWHVGGPGWGLALILILGSAIRHARERVEKLQAQLVLVGLLPLILFIVGVWGLMLAGLPIPDKVDQISSLFLLPFLIAIAIAMFRYELVDMEVVVERSILYSILTSTLFLLFYAFLGIGSTFASNQFGSDHSIWVASVAALTLGLLVNPIRRWLQAQIETKVFPERSKQRQRLTRLAAELPASGSVAAMGVRLVESLQEILGASDVSLFLVSAENKKIDWEASAPENRGAVEIGGRHSTDDPTIRDFVAHGVLRRNAIPRDLVELSSVLDACNAEALLPLVSNSRLIGILALGAPSEKHRAEDEHTLNLFASNIAMVFENVRLFQSATFDGLTGLPRKEIVLDRLREEVKRSERHQRPLSIAMLDLDHFKGVNDKYGHLVGDSILRTVAETFRQRLRTTDQIGRFGGEEFIVILPETAMEQALDLAEDLRRSVENIDFHTERGDRVQTRVSIGVATLNVDSSTSSAEAMISAADMALYRAKQNGRNRTEMAHVM